MIEITDLKMYYCGTQACTKRHAWGPGMKEHYKLHYIHEGKGIYQLGNRTFHLTQGEAFLISPGDLAYYEADEKEPWRYTWCAFDGYNVALYLRQANMSSQNPIISMINVADKSVTKEFAEAVSESTRDIQRELESCLENMVLLKHLTGVGVELRQQSLLYQLMALLVEHAKNEHTPLVPLSNQAHYVKKVMAFIEVHYSQKLFISDIAHQIGLNRQYVSQLFKDALGTTPQAYLIQFRMNKATHYMAHTSMGVSEIARSVGYEDPLVFSRMFRKVVGCSPTAYIKEKRH